MNYSTERVIDGWIELLREYQTNPPAGDFHTNFSMVIVNLSNSDPDFNGDELDGEVLKHALKDKILEMETNPVRRIALQRSIEGDFFTS